MDPRSRPTRAEPLSLSLAYPASPELALIDPVLRCRLIVEDQLAAHFGRHHDQPAGSSTREGEIGVARGDQLRRVGSHTSRRVFQGVCAVTVALAALLGIASSSPRLGRADARGVLTPPVATSTAASRALGSAASLVGRTVSARGTARRGPEAVAARGAAVAQPSLSFRRFAWAPVAGASSYAVAIYQHGVPVFQARSRVPSLAIPLRPPSGGPRNGLGPGTYEWDVWPIHKGQRSRAAVVRSQLTIPASR